MEVHRELGGGFLEAVYQEALSLEFNENSIPFLQEKMIDIYYKDKLLNKKYICDFICYNEIIIELKAVDKLKSEHTAQVLNYLKATNMKLGLLINFGGKSLEYKRLVN
jgi:GxxExxY protein